MNLQGPHLVFETSDGRFGVPAERVRQVVWLPVLEEASDGQRGRIGIAHLQEDAVEVVDLDLARGERPEAYTLEHRLLDLEVGDRRLGLVVSDVIDVVDVDEEDLVHPSDERVLVATVRSAVGPVDVVDLDELAALPASDDEPPLQAEELFTGFEPEELAELSRRQQRAIPQLGRAPTEHERAVVVAESGGASLAIPVEELHGFVRLGKLTPIPDTPRHVLGLANHRGEVVTVLDPSPLLGAKEQTSSPSLAALVQLPEGPTGIAVDRAGRTISIGEDELVVHEDDPPGVEGTIEREGRRLPVLDVAELLRSDRVVVDQEA